MSTSTQQQAIPIPVDGFMPDQPPTAVPPTGLTLAQNWMYRDGILMVRPGLTKYATNTLANRPLNITQFVDPTLGLQTVIATLTKWYKYDQTTNSWVDITGTALTGSETQPTIFRVFYKGTPLVPFLIGTNGKDAMKKWSAGAATYLAAGGSPPVATCMAVAANRCILGNLQSGPNASQIAVDVSALNDFESGWGATLTAFLADTPGPIVGMLEQGALSTAIYKTDAIYNMVAVSDVFPFRFELKQSGIIGPAGPLCITPITTGIHAYLAADGSLKQYDGVTIKDMGRKFQVFISNSVDFPTISRSRIAFDATHNELWVIFPLSGTSSCNAGCIVNLNNGSLWPLQWDSNSFGCIGFGNIGTGPTWSQVSSTWAQQTKTWAEFTAFVPGMIAGDVGGTIFQVIGTDDNTAVINHDFETGLNALTEDVEAFKTVHMVDHYFNRVGAANVVSLQLGLMNYGESRVLSVADTVDLQNAGPYRTGFRQTARMFSLRVSGSTKQSTQWAGAGFNITERGRR